MKQQVKGAKDATTLPAEDVAHLKILVEREKGTVMDMEMEESMMVMQDVVQDLSVEATIVRSLELTIMRKTTAVKETLVHLRPKTVHNGVSGANGAAAQQLECEQENKDARAQNAVCLMEGLALLILRNVIVLLRNK